MADFPKLNLPGSSGADATKAEPHDPSEGLSEGSPTGAPDSEQAAPASDEPQIPKLKFPTVSAPQPPVEGPPQALQTPSQLPSEAVQPAVAEPQVPSYTPVSEPVAPSSEAVPEPVLTSVDKLETPAEETQAAESELDFSVFGDDELEFGPSNPLLDDDDEELWGDSQEAEPLTKTELLRGTTGEIMDRDDIPDDDLEAFEGTFETPAEVVNPLLDDDDDEFVASGEGAPEGHGEPAGAVASEEAEALRQRVIANAEPKRFFPEGLDPEFDKRVERAPSKKEVVAAEREQKIRKKAAAEAEAKEFKSDFIRKAVETTTVNEKGDTRSEQARERKRLRKTAPGGKLDTKEIEFFKNMGSRKNQYTEGLRAADLLSGPMNEYATPQEKRERLQKLERVFDSRTAYRQGANFILNEKMVQTLQFLALFRYAKPNHVAQMFGESPRTAQDRLYRMQQNGLVDSRKIYAGTSIWFLTEAGLIVSGYDMRKVTDSRLTYSMFPHQFTVNHVAANLWGGKLNVLGLADFPVKNRLDKKGQPKLGEQLTSELEILSAFSKMKLFEDATQFRPKLMDIRDREFKKWAAAEDRASVPSPEMIYGNEWLFTLFPPIGVGVAYHVPDLVVKRPRALDGGARSIAVEIEINNKPETSYKRTLQAYADDKVIFDKVIWVCKTIGPAKKLEKVGKELGMIQSGKLKIVPIWVEGGVFKGRDLWTI